MYQPEAPARASPRWRFGLVITYHFFGARGGPNFSAPAVAGAGGDGADSAFFATGRSASGALASVRSNDTSLPSRTTLTLTFSPALQSQTARSTSRRLNTDRSPTRSTASPRRRPALAAA